MPIFLLIAKFGLSGGFNMVYLANSIFPVVYATTTIGVCSLFARSITILAPEFAELEKPYPMVIFAVLAGISIILSFFLDVKKRQE